MCFFMWNCMQCIIQFNSIHTDTDSTQCCCWHFKKQNRSVINGPVFEINIEITYFYSKIETLYYIFYYIYIFNIFKFFFTSGEKKNMCEFNLWVEAPAYSQWVVWPFVMRIVVKRRPLLVTGGLAALSSVPRCTCETHTHTHTHTHIS